MTDRRRRVARAPSSGDAAHDISDEREQRLVYRALTKSTAMRTSRAFVVPCLAPIAFPLRPAQRRPYASIHVRWDDALPIVAHLLSLEPDLHPSRWRYRDYPDPAALAALKGVAVPDLMHLPSA